MHEIIPKANICISTTFFRSSILIFALKIKEKVDWVEKETKTKDWKENFLSLFCAPSNARAPKVVSASPFVPSLILIDETTCVCHIHSHLSRYVCSFVPIKREKGKWYFFAFVFLLFYFHPHPHIITLSISGSFSHSSSLKKLHMEFQFSDSCDSLENEGDSGFVDEDSIIHVETHYSALPQTLNHLTLIFLQRIKIQKRNKLLFLANCWEHPTLQF